MNPEPIVAELEATIPPRCTTQYTPATYRASNETMRCPDCAVSWKGADPCWCCGAEHPPPPGSIWGMHMADAAAGPTPNNATDPEPDELWLPYAAMWPWWDTE